MTIPVEHSPVHIEQKLRELANQIALSVTTRNDALLEVKTAKRELDVAWARAILSAEGPEYVRRAKAELATMTERTRYDVAETAHKYAESRAKALQDELGAYQSINRSVGITYAAAGKGEW